MGRKRVCLVFLVCAGSALAAPGTASDMARARAALSGLPLRFEANQGQWNAEVRYAARSVGGALFLTDRGAALKAGSRRVDLALLGSNPKPPIEGIDPLALRTNYFVGHRDQWRQGVANVAKVAYRSVYPGIDILYYGNQNQLEYDFVLQPGADPSAIRLQFQGADGVRLTPEGDLAIKAGGAQFLQKRPVIYQRDANSAALRPVDGRYELHRGGVVGLRLGAYDRSRPLTIDPTVTYAAFLGGSGADKITAVASDTAGFLYIAGSTYSSDLPSFGATVQTGFVAGQDGFVARIDPHFTGAASVVYLTYLGGARDDAVTAMYVTPTGTIYVTGTTNSSDFPLAGANVQKTLALSTSATIFNTDAFLTVIDPVLGLQYSTYYGGTGDETPHGVGLGPNGLMYIFGTTNSKDLPVTPSAIQSALAGPSDAFVASIDGNSTTLVYGSYLGGEDADDGRAMVVAPDGTLYFAASTYSLQFPMAGASYRTTRQGIEAVAVGRLDLTQSGSAGLVYSTYFGGSWIDEVRQIALDANSKLLLTGWTLSADFPVTANAVKAVYGGAGNGFVARVNPAAPPSAFVEYSTYLGGSGGDVAYGVTEDRAGSIYVTGYTLSKDFPVTSDALQPQWGNGIDAFLVKLNPAVAGTAGLQYSTYLGGTGTHAGQAVAVAADGSIYLAGYTTPDLTLSGMQNGFLGGASDGFVVVLQQATAARPVRGPSIVRHTNPWTSVVR